MSKVIVTMLNEFGEEKEQVIKQCDTKEEVEQFVLEHEQDFVDNPDIYSVYIED